MKKILVALLGGTISSHLNSKKVVELGEPGFDKTYFQKIKSKTEYEIISPVSYSSENASVDDYRKAIGGIIEAVEEMKPDGVLILHGTDSMHYFAQLAVRTLSYLNVPVVITGSKLPPDDSHSDAIKNIKLSLGFLDAASEGNLGNMTFGVVYTDSFTGEATFINANKITGADINGDYKMFKGAKKTDFGSELYKIRAKGFVEKKIPIEKVLVIPAVPGFPIEAISGEGYDAVLIEGYHSGTAESNKLPDFVKKCSDRGIFCYLAPVPEAGYVYESRKKLEDAGVKVISGVSLEGAWAEIVLGL